MVPNGLVYNDSSSHATIKLPFLSIDIIISVMAQNKIITQVIPQIKNIVECVLYPIFLFVYRQLLKMLVPYCHKMKT